MKPMFCWVGSKTRQWKNLSPLFDNISRTCYVEPFGGSGAVFFAKQPERYEVYNDNNRLLVNLFRSFRNNDVVETFQKLGLLYPMGRVFWHELHGLCKAYLKGEKERDAYISKIGLTQYNPDLVVAFAFFYVMRLCFAGVYKGAAFAGGCKGDTGSKSVSYRMVLSSIEEYKKRFENVLIEDIDAFDCLRRYDHTKTFFYVDPPYETETSKKYDVEWTPETTDSLVSLVSSLQGSVVLSCYNNERYERLFDYGFKSDSFKSFASSNRIKDSSCVRTETVYYRLSDYAKEKLGTDTCLF